MHYNIDFSFRALQIATILCVHCWNWTWSLYWIHCKTIQAKLIKNATLWKWNKTADYCWQQFRDKCRWIFTGRKTNAKCRVNKSDSWELADGNGSPWLAPAVLLLTRKFDSRLTVPLPKCPTDSLIVLNCFVISVCWLRTVFCCLSCSDAAEEHFQVILLF